MSPESESQAAHIPCELVLDLMPEAVGGDLAPTTEAVLERHVRECLSCARQWHSHEDAHAALTSIAPGGGSAPALPDGFFDDLHSGIAGEVRRERQVSEDRAALERGRRGMPRVLRYALMAATLCLGFLLGKLVEGEQAVVPDSKLAGVPAGLAGSDPVLERFAQFKNDPEFQQRLAQAFLQILEDASRVPQALPVELRAAGLDAAVVAASGAAGTDF